MRRGRLTAASLRITIAALAFAAFPAASHADEYSSSVVGTDFDFIRDSDPSAFLCLKYKGSGPREMPDKRGATPLIQEAFIFVSYFTDGTSVDMAIDTDFELLPSQDPWAAAEPGRLPAMYPPATRRCWRSCRRRGRGIGRPSCV